ncbi:MAG: VanW family protein [Candidatus Promineofilum sp.]|nr:VanW family protein [Promineifilum sp.]
MQAISPRQQRAPVGRNLGYFLIPPLVGLALLVLVLGLGLSAYRAQHSGRVYTGVTVQGLDLSEMTVDEAQAALAGALPYAGAATVTLVDPASGDEWPFAPAQLGIAVDATATAAAAFDVGRSGGPLHRLQDTFQSWYYGRDIAPIVVYDEAQLDRALTELGDAVERSAVSASWQPTDSGAPAYAPAQIGRHIDRAYLREQLLEPIRTQADARVELLVHNIYPPVYDSPQTITQLTNLYAEPVRFYFPQPLDDLDLSGVTLPAEELARWVRVEQVEEPGGRVTHRVLVDENAARNWLAQFGTQFYREPVNARYYFNDDTRELVLVSPHVNGRELDVEATLQRFVAQINSDNHAVPIVLRDITPVAHSGATAADLGITELITETTTWFYGSSDARKHNIARAAANFYGVVVAPGEEFSFNRYLGSVSETDGYEVGLVIVGGRTLRGVGGGVCQVSTTLYQTAFWSGFPIVERWEHGYMVGYYNDGEGPGMDATVFSPIVDFRFINNTPHHLLIENYYNEEFESLTFKFYSTSMGRTVVKTEPVFENIVPPPEEDVWEFDAEIAEGTVEQYDYATEGARVTVQRQVFNAAGELIEEKAFVSNYIPWPNVYRYGPGVEEGDYSLVPEPEE